MRLHRIWSSLQSGAFAALIFLLGGFSLLANALVLRPDEAYLLQFREIRRDDKTRSADRSIEGPLSFEVRVKPGEKFYSRESGGGFQTSFSGEFELTEKRDSFKVNLTLRRSDLRDDPGPSLVIRRDALIRGWEPETIETVNNGKKMLFELSVAHFLPETGLRYPISRWSVKLVDNLGRPVAGAKGSLVDEEWNPRTNGVSDSDGALFFGDEREFLPLMTFAAEHQKRGLFAVANLDRAQASKVFTVIMRKRNDRPPGFKANFR